MKRDRRYITLNVEEASLKTRNPTLSLLFEVSDILSSPLGVRDALGKCLSRILGFFQLDSGRIYLLEDNKNCLVLCACHGMDPQGLERLNIRTGFSGRAIQTKSFIAHRVSELPDKERMNLLMKRGLKSILCVPLITRDRALGVMNLSAKTDVSLDEDQIDLLTTIGNQVAVAVDNERLYHDLENKIHALNEQREMITFFAYSISHDLKSPAASLFGLTRRLKEKYALTLDTKGREYCDLIMRTARQMLALVEMINAYISAKESALHLETFSVAELLASIQEEFGPQLEERGVRVTGVENLPPIVADRMGMSRIFRNLMDNALKYGGEGLSEICVEYRREGDQHVFVFADNGQGLPETGRERLFEPFQRRKSAKGVTGTGMGLSIVKEILKRHQGQIRLDPSAPAKGLRFSLSLSANLQADPGEDPCKISILPVGESQPGPSQDH